MAARPAGGSIAAVIAILVLMLAGCGDRDAESSAAAQRRQLTRAAMAAVRAYNPATTPYGVYTGRTARRRSVWLRVSARRRVRFSIRFTCPGRSLRAFPDRPPRLGRGGVFSYREHTGRYRLRVSGRVRLLSARGTLRLKAGARRGPGCRTATRWRATLR
jgi:hypothetical protein